MIDRRDPSEHGASRAYRVVVIDDHADTRELMLEALTHEGFEVGTYETADLALEAIRRVQPDVVITDMNLRGMSGLALSRVMRSDAHTRSTPLVAMTGCIPPSEPFRDLFDAYLLKPIDIRLLAPMLATLIEASAVRGDV